jgi:altronate dehydratase large subunit
MEFLGFIRPDGSVGCRNHLLVISTDPTTDRLCLKVAGAVYNAVPVVCGPAKHQLFGDYLSAMINNPNAAGAVLLEPKPQGVGEKVAGEMSLIGKPVEVVDISAAGGPVQAVARSTRAAMAIAREISTYRRQLSLFSRLTLGIIYKEDSKTADLLLPCIQDIIENSNGRIVIAREVVNKKDKVNNLHAVKKLGIDDPVGRDRGLYELEFSPEPNEIMKSMILKGVQVVLVATGSSYSANNALVPVVNITADKNYYELMEDSIELNLSNLDYKRYDTKEYRLLIISEIIATASGKLTKAEALKI